MSATLRFTNLFYQNVTQDFCVVQSSNDILKRVHNNTYSFLSRGKGLQQPRNSSNYGNIIVQYFWISGRFPSISCTPWIPINFLSDFSDFFGFLGFPRGFLSYSWIPTGKIRDFHPYFSFVTMISQTLNESV